MKNIAIIGGGAAGFFTAINIKENIPDAKVTIFEKTDKLLAKVRISGGGRCNVTNVISEPIALAKNYPRGEKQLTKVFKQFTTSDTVKWFETRGVELKVEDDGRIFPVSNSSESIINCFLKLTTLHQIEILTNTPVQKIKSIDNYFELTLQNKTKVFDYVVICTGGHPKIEGFDWLSNLELQFVTPLPSLFSFNIKPHPMIDFMGLSFKEITVKVAKSKLQQTGPLIITHWGFSGPAILKLSAWGARELAEKNYQFDLIINWTGKETETTTTQLLENYRLENPKKLIFSHRLFDLPTRIWEYFCQNSEIETDRKWQDISKKQLNKLVQFLHNDIYAVKGKTTYKEEFVTAGGLQLSEIDINTMESVKQAGLYFAGEVVNIDGITGGFNFQNAWSNGFLVAKSIAEKLNH